MSLFSPDSQRRSGPLPASSIESASLPPTDSRRSSVADVSFDFTPNQHRDRIAATVEKILSGQMQKVVLSRGIELRLCESELAQRVSDPWWMVRRFLQSNPNGQGHMVTLEPAGEPYCGAFFVGSNPELLIARKGRHIEALPLAGTVPRCKDPVQDQARATELQLSAKNLHEHAFVTADIAETLSNYCTSLEVPASPCVTATSHTWHLGTPIRGTLRGEPASALELAAMLHPTPAVSGFPQKSACEFLTNEEPHRGFYAGAVGWTDARGDGAWRVAIRGATVFTQKGEDASVRIHARSGGGIVAASLPDDEVQETTAKLGPVFRALGLDLEQLQISENRKDVFA
ncbi:isochorismate synthase [Corynebacterium gerontici]|uniref:isochorismate synthase n=1 Tax=Corynebacterium gerontici TaxID=2079234 RepID=UPI0013DE3F9B|nr:chorismate-binding protein [Corynebacterium gerontici]